jgi:hypothetical protein
MCNWPERAWATFTSRWRGPIWPHRDGHGQAKVLVEGRSKYPFHLAANAMLAPDLWRIALNGRVNGVDVASRNPLQIVPEKGTYTLRPATLRSTPAPCRSRAITAPTWRCTAG